MRRPAPRVAAPVPLAELRARLAGRRVTVMGLGLFGGGAGVTRFVAEAGAHVTATDLRAADALGEVPAELDALGVRAVLGEHRERDFVEAEVVVVNPAVPPSSPFLALARAAGARLTSAIELLLASCPAPMAAVTGTQGKSSTCHLLAGLLAESGRRVHLGGNIGGDLLSRLDEVRPDDRVVIELSSYQLEALPGRTEAGAPLGHLSLARLTAAGVTNVLADHLERHGSQQAYAAAKRRLLDLLAPGGAALLPRDDAVAASWAADAREALWRPLWLDARGPGGSATAATAVGTDAAREGALAIADGAFKLEGEELARLADLALAGDFQRRNALMALGLAWALGAEPAELAPALGRLRGLPHRLEDLGLRGGVRVWDNGVSTTPDSTISALDAPRPGFTLLCGGQAKRLPLERLVAATRGRVGRAVCFGAAAEELARAFARGGVPAVALPTLAAGVGEALAGLAAGGELLFSPACASFDAWPNYLARARAFQALLPPPDGPAAPDGPAEMPVGATADPVPTASATPASSPSPGRAEPGSAGRKGAP